ncbi:MAG: hypothetical protein KBT45_01390 [Bacteroidales bacterium]|nr:hypothetical protein [Candidatus Colimorpha pelethequi]
MAFHKTIGKNGEEVYETDQEYEKRLAKEEAEEKRRRKKRRGCLLVIIIILAIFFAYCYFSSPQ